ncbi:MAG: polysaccharide biosynthesis protein [Candidatus Wallbacteria bacterium]|nr:polysaccharide biosynthesis protein [Candidatus Wallbacteria bacterium]
MRNRKAVTVIVNLAVTLTAFFAALVLRFDLIIPVREPALWAIALGLIIAVKAFCYSVAGLNEGWWRFIGVRDVPRFVAGNALASALLVVQPLLNQRPFAIPKSVFVIDFFICTLVMLGTRLLSRLVFETRPANRYDSAQSRKLLIIGAGRGGTRLLDELTLEGGAGYDIVGFVDDDPSKVGSRIRGTEVVGSTGGLAALLEQHEVTDVIVAVASPRNSWLRGIMKICEQHAARCRILPSFSDYLNGKVFLGQVRNLKLEDLLGRVPVQLDERNLAGAINGKVVLVTGGAGSIGSELCRQIARFGPSELVLLDKDESGIFFIQHELRRRFPQLNLRAVIGDIRNLPRMKALFREHAVSAVFHAAAYKHVPLMEENIHEAISTNIQGTMNLARLAQDTGCEKFVLISTDKAVKPSSVMGATKRAAELCLWALPEGLTQFVAVRFGNVLGSAGSVIPLFQRQIQAGGPVTVTHPEATRYFMTVQEAVQLVLHASTLAESRVVYMLDMGEPVSIVELAENLIRLSGLRPNVDVPIEFSGLRPGEKLHEELLLKSEESEPSALPKIARVKSTVQPRVEWTERFAEMESLVREASDARLLDWLCRTVQEFRPGSHFDALRQQAILKPVVFVDATGASREAGGTTARAVSSAGA